MQIPDQGSVSVFPDFSAGVDSRMWFAAHTCSCQEKKVAQHLTARSIEFFLPVYRKLSHWKNGQHVAIERPLFPNYLFVNIHRNERVRVLELPGVHSVVGSGREPIPLPSTEIEALRRGIDSLSIEPHPYLKTGEKVIIRSGPLQGMAGIVKRQKGCARVVLGLDLIVKSIAVELDERDLEVVRAAPEFCR